MPTMPSGWTDIIEGVGVEPAPQAPRILRGTKGDKGDKGDRGDPGPPGAPGIGFDPDALPIAPDRDIAPGDAAPIVPDGSIAFSTIAECLIRFDGEVWVALGGSAEPTYPAGAVLLTDAQGRVLVNDSGEVLIRG